MAAISSYAMFSSTNLAPFDDVYFELLLLSDAFNFLLAPLPFTNINGGCMTAISENQLAFLGGTAENIGGTQDTIYVLNTVTYEWTLLDVKLPNRRGDISCKAIRDPANNNVVVVISAITHKTDVLLWNVTGGTFLPPVRVPMGSSSSGVSMEALTTDKIIFGGGEDGKIYTFDLTDGFVPVGCMLNGGSVTFIPVPSNTYNCR